MNLIIFYCILYGRTCRETGGYNTKNKACECVVLVDSVVKQRDMSFVHAGWRLEAQMNYVQR